MTTPETVVAKSRPSWARKPESSRACSSAVRSATVAARQCGTSLSPSNTPMVISVLPTSSASSMPAPLTSVRSRRLLEHQVVDQACRPDAGGDRQDVAGAGGRGRRKAVRLDQGDVLGLDPRGPVEHGSGGGLDLGGLALAPQPCVQSRAEPAGQGGRAAPLLGREVGVARRYGQPVGLANDGAGDDLVGEVQV